MVCIAQIGKIRRHWCSPNLSFQLRDPLSLELLFSLISPIPRKRRRKRRRMLILGL
ncbi:hypothetical protein Hanom_Chr04g00376701 [Helianthus anomalus]